MRIRRTLIALSVALAASLLVSACDEAEQGRVLRYEKGTYLGQKDPALSNRERNDLRARARMQRGS
jgi:hypothetical protein